jgi:threonine/homoserine/homoserine lactone efflux protein
MDGLASFVAAVIAVLGVPGPTNTLLMTSGASRKLLRSLILIPAETTAYALSISALILVVGPVVGLAPHAKSAMHFGCAVYLTWIAWSLWKLEPAGQIPATGVRFRDVFVTTLLNPKGLVFAFVIFPPGSGNSDAILLSRLAIFAGISTVIAFMWIALGAAIQTFGAARLTTRGLQRAASVTLLVFAALLFAEAFRRLV